MTNQLPELPSELLRLSIKDLEACEKDPIYKINMGEWHNYDFAVNETKEVCHVCLAGSVMAQTLGVPFSENLCPEANREGDMVFSLNSFRGGEIHTGLITFGSLSRHDQPIMPDREITPYERDPEAFKKEILALADGLQSEGF